MILVDTSVWIELLNGKLGTGVSEEQLLNFVTCGRSCRKCYKD